MSQLIKALGEQLQKHSVILLQILFIYLIFLLAGQRVPPEAVGENCEWPRLPS